MQFNREQIAALIPHQGRMCLLDRVEDYREDGVVCSSRSHRAADNPFLVAGRLPAPLLIEYAAQAAAVHAAIAGTAMGGGERVALLGAVKAIRLHCRHVAPDCGLLSVAADAALRSADGAIYRFCVSAADRALVEGRLVLVLPPA